MSFTIVELPVQHSKQIYPGIKCRVCGVVSYKLDDLQNRHCSYCNTTHNKQKTETETGPGSKYTLYWTAGKKATKAHWSANGRNTLCMVPVSTIALGGVDNDRVCVNCRKLKKQRVIR